MQAIDHTLFKLQKKYRVCMLRRYLAKQFPSKTMANMVLKDYSEVQDAINKIEKMALPMHNDKYKNWDIYHMLSFILKNGCDASSVLDMGCANYGVILPLLEKFGFKELYGCDLVIEKEINKGNIHYSRQDMQKTNYPDSFFDFITSISVIEHGVNIDRYLKETARLLKPGGYLLTTTDYWPDTIDTTGLYPYGELGEMKIFTQEEIELIFVKAAKYGLRLIKPMDFRCKNKVVHWERVDRRFTFIYFVLIKSDTN